MHTIPSEPARILVRRIRWWLGLFMAGLVFSGVTAIPLDQEVAWLMEISGAREALASATPGAVPSWAAWLARVEQALRETRTGHPMLFYGTDWLAFGHLMIALAFVGAWRDPVRNVWLLDFGLLACALVVPWALAWGAVRGIPVWWRLIDCSFGVVGAVPLLLALRLTRRLAAGPASPAGCAAC